MVLLFIGMGSDISGVSNMTASQESLVSIDVAYVEPYAKPWHVECPIAPGDSLTYKFQATQHGSAWYHSHHTTQYGDGLLGPLIINGPATADYDEDLGLLFLSDWSHTPAYQLWEEARHGTVLTLETGLLNGTNTWNCTGSTDPNCVGGGRKFETAFEAGKKYRIRLVNSARECRDATLFSNVFGFCAIKALLPKQVSSAAIFKIDELRG